MPIYEYTCKTCHTDFERLVRGDTTPRCPSCDASDVEKQLSAFAVGGRADPAEWCGRCGQTPGSCAIN
jgi:putative FmdB family regulatory protein